MIYYGRQSIDQSDIDAVIEVLRSDFLTQGPAVETFERAAAAYAGAGYAAAVNSGTSALHIACLAAGLGKGDLLWTSPNTFAASANCALYCGAAVDFVDIDEVTYNLNVDLLEEKLKKSAAKPKIVLPVHFAGQSCDMERVAALAGKYGFTVIEDASHALGAGYKKDRVGGCQYSDMAVFSFHPVKIVTTGEGGMTLTNSEKLYERLRLFRSHGITREHGLMTREPDGPWYYEQTELGFNYRMTDIQAALGASQLKRADEFVARRRRLAARYGRLLADLPLCLPVEAEYAASSWHIYVARLDFSKTGISKKDLFARMKEKGITLNLHYIPVHLHPYYQKLGFLRGDFPASEKYYSEAFTLPLYCGLTDEQQDYVAASLKDVLRGR
ncbi:MAG: UDP-4-amino-4,6-dideoxy-N-acetyl-beta-L-altrosamine transaminase [Acidaminococcales bacterium]|jgi:UDP-4-amino-4,6-dideoxy-N-acetyl-beta-L-altrosamine transaminase|nr:UDP-4-amino-4,6-dideoxy-N-acetyl-beta-L-altrosamine transaminase [Acidaminococcales bacterium]